MEKKQIIDALQAQNYMGKIAAIAILFFGILGCIILFTIMLILDADWSRLWTYPIQPENLPFQIPLIVAVKMSVISGIVLLIINRSRRKILALLKNGTRKNATIVSSLQNFAVTMNKTPQRIVKFKSDDGKIYTFKSFDYGLVPQLKENIVVPIICNDKGDAFPDPDHFKENSQTSVRIEDYDKFFAHKCAESANQHFMQKNYSGAIMAYEMALEKHEDPEFIEKMAQSYEKLNQNHKAEQVRAGNWKT